LGNANGGIVISERVSVEFIHGDALLLFYVELLRKSGQEGERLNVWQESDIPEDFSGRIM